MTIALRADSRAAEEKSMDQTELERAIEAIDWKKAAEL